MEIGIYQNGSTIAVNLIADDVAFAAALANHIATGAPAGVQVWQEGTVVAVFRELDSPRAAGEWPSELRAGMAEGRPVKPCPLLSVFNRMRDAGYYRGQAARARRLARQMRSDVAEQLEGLARDYDDIASDLERGAIEIRHPELMPQLQGSLVHGRDADAS